MKRWAFSIIAVIACALSAQATIRTVNSNGTGQYLEIYLAVNAAVTGDTILIAPGTYNSYSDNPNINGKKLHVIGAGWDLVTTKSFTVQGAGATRTIIEGVNTGSNYISLSSGADSLIVRRCRTIQVSFSSLVLIVEDCILATSGDCFSYAQYLNNVLLTFSHCLFVNTNASPANNHNAIDIGYGTQSYSGTVLVQNCAFVNYNKPFDLYHTSTVKALAVINSVFYDWGGTSRSWGTYGPATVFEYNASDSTAPAIPGFFSDHVLLAGDDPFVNYDETANYVHGTSDLHLNGGTGGLLLTDAGHPDPSFNDLDGSRNNIGIYGGPRPLVDNGVPGYPFAISLTVSSPLFNGESLEAQSVGRIGPRY
ncbi:hypothetical protein IT157_07950 [bacterium]|nr:hypothetical protein [bacterium]